ncbi:MAG: hypothetical protein C0469_10945 [Cyanobacteria bacterium DS2.3.42]|nr:hypothetical protein [Cyanobacteria bacterium DS2.3.42]
MSIFSKKAEKSAFGNSDRVPEGSSAVSDSGLRQQAGQLLCDKDCNSAFSSRMSVAGAEGAGMSARGKETPLEEMAHAAENGEALKGMNVNAEQAVAMLDKHPSSELYAHLETIDQQAAVDLAVKDQRFERLAMDSDNRAVKDEVSMRRYAQPVSA